MEVLLEVCVDNVQSAINAFNGGASRLELCSALSEGGLTPSRGLFQTVKSIVSIPVYVMLRPRRGMDFVYTESELAVIKYDAVHFMELGADGFVFGILNADGSVNIKACKEVLDIISPLPSTFHRAFDVVSNPFDAITSLIELQFCTLLTSGQEKTATDGIALIKKLVEYVGNRIIIMAGAGIDSSTVTKILSETSVRVVHASCKKIVKYSSNNKNALDKFDFNVLVTDEDMVRKIVTIINNEKNIK